VMSSTLQANRSAENPLRRRFAGLRRRLRFVAAIRGGGWLLACVLSTLLVVGLIDYRIHLPGLVRAFALTGLLASAGILLYRYLFEPLSEPTDDLSLALRIEER